MSLSQRPEIKTIANLESAFAGESMAHVKYRYFAKLCRDMGDDVTARAFEATADQEILHAFGHLDLLYPKAGMTPARALQIAALFAVVTALATPWWIIDIFGCAERPLLLLRQLTCS